MPWHSRHPWTRKLSGLPELQLFESDAQQHEVLEELAEEARNWRTADYWWAIAILAAVVLAVRWLAKWVLRMLAVPEWVRTVGVLAAIVAAVWLTLRWMYRWGTRDALREKLLVRGVPVCLHCGYSLKGLSPAQQRCPECGREVDERVREVLARRSPAAEPEVIQAMEP